MVIVNPIYDVVFKQLMENEKVLDEKDKLIAELLAKLNKQI